MAGPVPLKTRDRFFGTEVPSDQNPSGNALDLDELNAAQREAVLAVDGPLLIIAGAGSGKTRVITHRIAHLITNLGIPPHAILAVTFTNKAANEMKERVERLTGLPARSLWVSTFHAAAVRMLRADSEAIGIPRDFAIYDEEDTEKLIREVIRGIGLDPKIDKPSDYAAHIGRAKDELLGPGDWLDRTRLPRGLAERIHDVYSDYQERLRRAHALDFGDLLVAAVRLLEVPEVGARWRSRFRYVMVDEYQDTNIAQCRMMQAISEGHRNLCVVGDDDQSIYEWRGADRRNILEFERLYPDARVVVLAENYRSYQPILDAASHLIAHNPRIREKKLFTSRKGGTPPVVHVAGNEYREAERVIEAIRENTRRGIPLREHAIFYRVHAQTRVLEELLSASGFPYQLLTGLSFYQRMEVKDVMAYLKLVANPADDLALLRVINNPSRGIGETSIRKLATYDERRALFDVLADVEHILDEDGKPAIAPATRRKILEFRETILRLRKRSTEVGVSELLGDVLDETRYLTQYDSADSEDAERIGNVRELISVAQEFQSSQENPSLASFLERTALATDVDDMDPNADAVVLSTLHSAKGLEFDHVFIVGCEESIFPHTRAIEEGRAAAMEEERRLAYVGFTRARKTLTLSLAIERRIYGRMLFNTPSRFLVEAGLAVPAARRAALADSSFWAPRGLRAPSGARAARGVPAAPTRTARATSTAPSSPTPVSEVGVLSEGDTVEHRKFGRGEVLYVADPGNENEVVQVRFPSGTKSLMSRFAGLTRVG